MRIGEVHIRKLFSSYVTTFDKSDQSHLLYCARCGQEFKIPRRNYMCESTSAFCPKCRALLRFGAANKNNLYVQESGLGPLTMHLRLDVFKDHVKLTVNGIGLLPTGYVPKNKKFWERKTYQEEFRFDTRRRKTTWLYTETDGRRIKLEIGRPDVLYKLGAASVLRLLYAHTSIMESKPQVVSILRTLRETVHKKLEQRVGHSVSSLFCSSGENFGWLLFPLGNIAYRMIFVDAPNLRPTCSLLEIGQEYPLPKDLDLDILRKSKGTVAGLIRAGNLPDMHSVRRLLAADPFALQNLIFCHRLFKQSDLAMRVFPRFSNLEDMGYTKIHCRQGLLMLRDYYMDDNALFRFLMHKSAWWIDDTARLLEASDAATQEELSAHPPRIQNLHDWLTQRFRRKDQPDFAIDIETEPIRRRLGMQLDQVRFFLPDQAKTLYAAGSLLHNCVGSYAERMRCGETHIVLMTNDRGRLVACIEVAKGEIRQAKLDRNDPVSKEAEINAKIIEWAKAVGIEYKDCSDIQESDTVLEQTA